MSGTPHHSPWPSSHTHTHGRAEVEHQLVVQRRSDPLEVLGWLLVTLAACAPVVTVGLAGHWTLALWVIGVVLLVIGSVLVAEVARRRDGAEASSR
jgi:hypothetical protein